MFKKTVAASLAIALLIAAGSYYSPHWTVHRMRAAIDDRDYEAFSALVDLPSLRESFKQQLAQSGDGDPARDSDPLAALGAGLARAVAGPLVDFLLVPAALIEMVNVGEPRITPAVMSAAVSRVPATPASLPEMTVSYRDLDTVLYQKAGNDAASGSFILRRQGWWHWKLAAVELAH